MFAGLALPPDRAMAAAVLAFAGGLLQTALSVATWPIRRYGPERRALAALFEALADSASSSAHASEPPPTTAQSTHAQETLGTLDRDRSVEAERFRALLSQAERMRIALLTLSRLRVRIERETPGSAAVAAMDRFLGLAAATLRSLAGERPAPPSGEMRQLVESLRCFQEETECEARRQMDALAGQLRAAADLADGAVPDGAARFARREASRSWRLRLKGTLATLRANFSVDSAACRHAIRLAVCVGIGEVLGRVLGLTRSYWAPMTIAIVLKPDFGGTIRTGVLRFAGTFAGLGLATALFHLSPPGTRLEILLLGLAVFFARAYGAANYGIAATNITAMVVLLQALGGVAPNEVILPRALNTVAGGTIALAAYAIWPTWERHRLGETLARMFEAYRDYFHQIRRRVREPGEGSRRARSRPAGRAARPHQPGGVGGPARCRAGDPARPNAGARRAARQLAPAGARDDGARSRSANQPAGAGAPAVQRVRPERRDDAGPPRRRAPGLAPRSRDPARPSRGPRCDPRLGAVRERTVRAGERGNGPHCEQPQYARGGCGDVDRRAERPAC